MSNTRLIYVSKQTAEVSNDKEGSFTNKVDDGVVVKVGDEINVEAIAINSVGVGAEIIEIPKRIKNYPYKTNSMVLNCAYYIHHNGHPFTCMLPLSTHNSVFSTIADTNYGYMDGTQTGWKILPFSSVKSKWGVQNQQLGQRFYLGSYVFAKGADPAKPIQNPLGIGQTTGAVPTIGIFEFYKTNLRFEVDTGYDNPANIANKITQDTIADRAFQTNVGELSGVAKPVIQKLLGKAQNPMSSIVEGTANLSSMVRSNQFFDDLILKNNKL